MINKGFQWKVDSSNNWKIFLSYLAIEDLKRMIAIDETFGFSKKINKARYSWLLIRQITSLNALLENFKR